LPALAEGRILGQVTVNQQVSLIAPCVCALVTTGRSCCWSVLLFAERAGSHPLAACGLMPYLYRSVTDRLQQPTAFPIRSCLPLRTWAVLVCSFLLATMAAASTKQGRPASQKQQCHQPVGCMHTLHRTSSGS